MFGKSYFGLIGGEVLPSELGTAETEINTPEGVIQVTMSIGMAIAYADDTIDAVLEQGDVALYQANAMRRSRLN